MAAVVEELVVRAALRDELSRPLDGVKRKLEETAKAANDLPPRDATGRFQSYKKSIDGTTRSTLDLDRWTRNASRTLDQMAGTTLARTATALTVVTGLAAGLGLKANASFELSRTAYGSLLGSVEQGDELFARLQQYNLATPFNLPQITSAEQTLLQFNAAGQGSIGMLKSLGDISALTSDPSGNLERMALAVGQIKSAGVLRAQDLNQLVQAGLPAYQILTEITGQTAAQIRQQMDSGLTLPADKFLSAIEQMQGSLSRFSGGAAKQAQTLSGLWSNFTDQIRMDLSDAASPLAAELKKEIPQAQALVHQLLTSVGPPMMSLLGDIVQMAMGLEPAVEPVVTALASGLGAIVDAAGPGLHDLVPVGVALGASLGQFFTNIAPMAPELVDVFVQLVGILPEFVDLLGLIVPLVYPIGELAGLLLGFEPVQGVLAALLATLLGYRAVAGVVGALQSFAGGIRQVAAAEEQEAAARGLGGGVGGAGGKWGKVAAGVGIAGGAIGVVSSMQDPSFSAGGLFGAAASGATSGGLAASIIPGVGTGVGALIGGAAGAGLYLGKTLLGGGSAPSPAALNSVTKISPEEIAALQAGTRVHVAPGAVVVTSPASTVDLANGVAAGMTAYAQERTERQ